MSDTVTCQLVLPVCDVLPVPLPEDGPPEERIPVHPVDFLEAALDRELHAYELHYLHGPLVLHMGGGWEDTLPAWLEAAVPKARVAQLLLEAAADVQEYDRMCSLEEVAAYLYTACLSFPLAQEWANVYFWASDRVMRAHGKLPEGQSIWDVIDPNGELGADRRELSDYERREYLDKLRRNIRRAVVKHRKEREKSARRAH
jgi:hypothetical protein